MKISINQEYFIRNEKGCSYIVSKLNMRNVKQKKHPLVMPIPPIYGYILSSFNGRDMEETINEIAIQLEIGKIKIRDFVIKVFENPHAYVTSINGIRVYLPPFLLVRSERTSNVSTIDDFYAYGKFEPHRPSIPFFLSLMITSKCYTNCIYCYADRHRLDDMNLNTLFRIIENAKKNNIPNVLITGGDILATKNWQLILSKLTSLGYSQLISTKIPLRKSDLVFLKTIGINEIQISIDSFEQNEVSKMVKVNKQYLQRIKQTFIDAEELGLLINVKSVLTIYNANIKTLVNMYDELSKHKSIKSWNIVPAFFSSHNQNEYEKYKVEVEKLKTLLDFIKGLKSNFIIEWKKMEDAIFAIQKLYTSEVEFVKKNKGCMANFYSMAIMSNGKATLCEMLYYNKIFYLGDAQKESIEKIWNSELAAMFNFCNKETSENTPCYSCQEFDKCKRMNFKKICIVDVINTHGADKWYYPDPRCPRSVNVNADRIIY